MTLPPASARPTRRGRVQRTWEHLLLSSDRVALSWIRSPQEGESQKERRVNFQKDLSGHICETESFLRAGPGPGLERGCCPWGNGCRPEAQLPQAFLQSGPPSTLLCAAPHCTFRCSVPRVTVPRAPAEPEVRWDPRPGPKLAGRVTWGKSVLLSEPRFSHLYRGAVGGDGGGSCRSRSFHTAA